MIRIKFDYNRQQYRASNGELAAFGSTPGYARMNLSRLERDEARKGPRQGRYYRGRTAEQMIGQSRFIRETRDVVSTIHE